MRVGTKRGKEDELVVALGGRLRPRFITDRAGVLCDVNLDACLVLDLGHGFLVGKRLALLIDEPDLSRMDHLLQSLGRSSPGASASMRIRGRTGALHQVEIEASLAAHGDRVVWTARLQAQRASVPAHALP